LSYRLLLPLILLVLAGPAEAQALLPGIAELADSSVLVVTGRVTSVAVQADDASIYTYATVAVDEVLKGQLGDTTIVVKELGGTLPTLGLYIADQARFRVDQHVLLFLAARPRDGTLYTVGLSRGKWDVLPDLQTGGRSAISGGLRVEFDAALRSLVGTSRAQADTFVVDPPEMQSAASFTFIPTSEGGPARWHQVDDGFSIPVDSQTAPPGLPGGGNAQLTSAIGAWNAVGSRLRMERGDTGPHSCPSQNFTGNGRIGLYWNDPCNEVSDGDATTFGIGGGFFTPGQQKTVNGVVFNAFLQGIAILNNAGPHLSTATCLQDAVTHVLGHAVGLGHSADNNALMYPTLRPGCASASSLASDDINGLRAIYPSTASGGSPPQPPTAITNSVALDTVTLSWTPATTGGPAQSYVLEAGSAPGLANITTIVLNSTNTSTVVGAVPAGLYYVRVRARNALGTSGPSPDTIVSVGPCSAPTVPTALAYSTADNLVNITWTPPAGGVTQGYWLYAGFAPGESSALVTSLGPTPGFAGIAPFGDYYVRIAARNTCAVGPQSPDLLVSVRPCTAAPNAPGALSHTLAGNVVTLRWLNPSSGNLPSRFIISAGNTPGVANLLVQNTGNNGTSFVAAAGPGTYYVRVQGQNDCGTSAFSNEITVVIP
jgi:hypothetical protein